MYPNGLFPAATSIRLTGVMHYSSAASILCNNPAKLEHLVIDNLQQVGQGCDHSFYRQANQRPDHHQSPPMWNYWIHEYRPGNPFGPAGPMQNLLGYLTGRCPNVRSLTLRKVGQRHLNQFTLGFIAKESDIYDELGTFISSMKATLQHVIFEQVARTALRHPLPPGQIFTPGDARFHVILYPHLFHEEWQCLETLKTGGVNMLFNDDYYDIRTLRGGVVKPVIRQQVKVMDHIGLGDPLAGILR